MRQATVRPPPTPLTPDPQPTFPNHLTHDHTTPLPLLIAAALLQNCQLLTSLVEHPLHVFGAKVAGPGAAQCAGRHAGSGPPPYCPNLDMLAFSSGTDS
mmetsp:Transcript_32410/g.82336  ORF Transcript_32410/g.82336 Transcript_32410/m.82336 type:complete len:99 (+) Transcript_32410:1573-1869(+)